MEVWTVSKLEIPQPVWPELTYFDGETPHRIVPTVARDGSATYDVSKLDAKAAALVDAHVARKIKDDPTKVIRVIGPIPEVVI